MRNKPFFKALAVAGAASLSTSVLAPGAAPKVVAAPQPQAQFVHTATNPLIATLPVRQALGAPQGELFASPPPPPKPRRVAVVAPPEPLAPPPMPYRVAGLLEYEGELRIVLARGDRLLPVQTGDALEGGYRVESIESQQVTLLYTALDIRQNLPVGSPLLASRSQTIAKSPALESNGDTVHAAQLRWEGPQKVQAGTPFDVALKLTSAEPVRTSPVRLNYDAKVLEPVAVRPGGLFADGEFNYRISRAGSIVVSGSRTEAVAADTDFVVVTFRPIQGGATAELNLSPLALRGNAGRIEHEPLQAFRTSIVH